MKLILSILALFFTTVSLIFIIDSELSSEAKYYLEYPINLDRAVSRDYLFMLGIHSPEGEQPIEYGKTLFENRNLPEPSIPSPSIDELMDGSPCELSDFSCWQRDPSANKWLSLKVQQHLHIHERWVQYPINNDYSSSAHADLLFLPDQLEYLSLLRRLFIVYEVILNSKNNGRVASGLKKQIIRLVGIQEPAFYGAIDYIVHFIVIRSLIDDALFLIDASNYSGFVFDISELTGLQFDIEHAFDSITAHELAFFKYAPLGQPFFSRNRTLNRAFECVNLIRRLANRANFDQSILNGADSCSSLSIRWWNLLGDRWVRDFSGLAFNQNIACHFHSFNDELLIFRAILELQVNDKFISFEEKLNNIERKNPYFPDFGIEKPEGQICFSVPESYSCTLPCLNYSIADQE